MFERVAYERWSGRKAYHWLKFDINFKSKGNTRALDQFLTPYLIRISYMTFVMSFLKNIFTMIIKICSSLIAWWNIVLSSFYKV